MIAAIEVTSRSVSVPSGIRFRIEDDYSSDERLEVRPEGGPAHWLQGKILLRFDLLGSAQPAGSAWSRTNWFTEPYVGGFRVIVSSMQCLWTTHVIGYSSAFDYTVRPWVLSAARIEAAPNPVDRLRWLDEHSEELDRYRGMWIALGEKGLLAADPSLARARDLAREFGEASPAMHYVPEEEERADFGL